jgi:hypothetical protein
MTDRERDAPRRSPGEDTDELPVPPVAPEEALANDREALADDALDDGAVDDDAVDDGDYEDDEEEPGASDIGVEADEEARESTAATAAGGASRLRLGQRLGRGQVVPTTAPLVTPSERAVRIDDRASQVFVASVVATFVGIVLFAMLWGTGGFFTTPHASPSPSPSAALSPSASSSPSASASPSISLQPSSAPPPGTSNAPPSPSPAGS